MRKLLLLPALLLGSAAAHAQTNAVKVDIIRPIFNTLALSFEHKLSESSSFQIGVAGTFAANEGGFSNSDALKTSGFAITPEYRFYLSEKRPALEGFYVAPYLRYQHLNQSGTYYSNYYYDPNNPNYQPAGQKYEASLNAFGLGVVVGRHWIFKQKFSLDAYAGPGYNVTGVSSNLPDGRVTKDDFFGYIDGVNYDLRIGLTFGIAF